MTDANETNFYLLSNLQQVRFSRPWIDAEFALYQKLCRNQEALLDYQLEQIKKAIKDQRESSRRT